MSNIDSGSNKGAIIALVVSVLLILGVLGYVIMQVADVGPQHEQIFGNREIKLEKAKKEAGK